jgi:ABC-type amino acid transport substrate-binding protein
MTVRKSILGLMLKGVLVTAVIATLVACGDPKQQPPAIVVTFDSGFLPPASLNAGLAAGIAADVANDTGGSGNVNWTCAPANNCGTFTPSATHSAAPATYQAPAQGGTVTVTATSVTDSTKSVSATIVIN